MVVTELLLQRTRAEVVARFYCEFFGQYPSWRKLSMATPHELEQFLRPLGLWRRRADVLVRLASALDSRRGRLPSGRADIEALPGVGQYVANAIQLIRWHIPAPLLDVNMARVLERYFGPRQLSDIRYDGYLQDLAWRTVDCDDALAVNWGMLDIGSMICRARQPICSDCPLSRGCNFSRGVSRAKEDQVRERNAPQESTN